MRTTSYSVMGNNGYKKIFWSKKHFLGGDYMKKRILAVSMVLAILMTMVSFTAFASSVVNSEYFDETPSPVITNYATGSTDATSTGGTMAFGTSNGAAGNGQLFLSSDPSVIPVNGTGNALEYVGTATNYGGIAVTLSGLTANKSYTVDFDLRSLGSVVNTYYVNYGSTGLGAAITPGIGLSANVSRTFIYSSSTYIKVFLSGFPVTGTFSIDNFTVTENDAITIINKPAGPYMAPSTTVQLGDQLSGSASGTVTWTSSSPTVATVDQTGLVHALIVGTTTISASVPGITADSFVLSVVNPSLAIKAGSKPVNNTILYNSSTTQLSSVIAGISGTATWTSSNTSAATIDSTGKITPKGAGVTTITLADGTYSDNFVLTVKSIMITYPTTGNLLTGTYMVVGGAAVTLGDSLGTGVSGTATWASTSTGVATVSSSGVLTPVAAGTTTISVTVGGQTDSFLLTVFASALTPNIDDFTYSRVLTTTTTSGNVPATARANATLAITSAASDLPTNGIGNALKVTMNSGSNTPSWDGVSFAYTGLTIGQSYTVGYDIKFLAIDAVNNTYYTVATGLSSALVAVAGASTHVIKTFTPTAATGTVQIYNGSQTANGTFVVDNLIIETTKTVAIGNIPPSSTMSVGATTTLTTSGTATGTTVWSSSAPSIATIDQTGLVTAVAVGTTTITVWVGNFTANFTLTVAAVILPGVSIGNKPTGNAMNGGDTRTLTYTLVGGLTGTPAWTSSSPTVASIDPSTGFLTAALSGTTTITLTIGSSGKTDSFVLTVSNPAVSINPSSTPRGNYMVLGDSSVTLTDTVSGGLTGTAVWSSSSPTVATVNSSTGVLAPVSVGSTTITVTLGGKTDSFVLNVLATALTPNREDFTYSKLLSSTAGNGNIDFAAKANATIALTSAPADLPTNGSGKAVKVIMNSGTGLANWDGIQFSLPGAITDQTSYTVSFDIKFLSIDTTNNTYYIDNTDSKGTTPLTLGNITAVVGASTHVTKTFTSNSTYNVIRLYNGAMTANGSFTIDNFVFEVTKTIAITNKPIINSMAVGNTDQLGLTTTGMSGQPSPVWASTDSTIATVDQTGLITAIKAGTATISATQGGITDQFVLTVILPTVTITGKPDLNVIHLGSGPVTLAATLFGLTGSVTWTSSSPIVATINSSTGIVNALTVGTTTITASNGGKSDSFVLTIAAAEAINTENFDYVTIDPATNKSLLGANTQFGPNDGAILTTTSNPSDLPINGSGSALKITLSNAYWGGVAFTGLTLTTGIKYAVSFDVNMISGTDNLNVTYGVGAGSIDLYSVPITAGTTQHVIKYFTATTLNSMNIFALNAAGTDVYTMDNFKVEQCAVVFASTYKFTNNYVSNIAIGSTSDAFTAASVLRSDTTLSYTNLQAGDVIATGTTVTVNTTGLSPTVYTCIVYGDVNGDGLVNLSDLVSVRNYVLGNQVLADGYKTAGDLYGEGNISLNDLVGMMSYISGSGTINQNR